MRIKRKICLLAALVLLFANLLMPSVFAEETDDFTKFELSADGKTLLRDGERFEIYQSSRLFYSDPRTVYEYENTVDMTLGEDGETYACRVYASSKNANVLWVQGVRQSYLYVSSAGKTELDAFLDGTSVRYTLENKGMNADISNEEIKGLDDASRQPINAIVVDVTTLADQQRYDVVTRDATYSFAYVHGAIYYIDNQYYYVNYEMLGNNYFDADGNFSYRSGSVPLTPVDAMTASVIDQTVQNLAEYDVEYTYESESWDAEASKSVFWVLFVVVGFLAPIPLLVLGLVLPVKRKAKDGKRWYSLAVLGGLWLLLAIILTVILVI
ncbi:MAG: hypothetical protein E7653_07605 [Ruminococcaceae bacterium]|nr:hypothetical protein [Oscillospiraceae bacterium]